MRGVQAHREGTEDLMAKKGNNQPGTRTYTPSEVDTLRELVTEAHGVIKDMRRERRELLEDLADLKEFRKDLREKVHKYVYDLIKTTVDRELEKLGKELQDVSSRTTEVAVARIFTQFDRLADLFMQGGDPSNPHVEDLVKLHAGGWKVIPVNVDADTAMEILEDIRSRKGKIGKVLDV
jgi:hypothetical protein